MKVRAAIVLLAAIALSGCTAAPAPLPTAADTPSASPTPAQTSTVFGGSCPELIGLPDIQAVYGQSVSAIEQPGDLAYPEVAVFGGIVCSWTFADGTATTLRVMHQPASVPVPASPPVCAAADGSCEFEAVESGFWLVGTVRAADPGTAQSQARALLERLAPALAAADPSWLSVSLGGAWAGLDCAALPGGLVVAAAPSTVSTAAGAIRCEGDSYAVELVPGAGWLVGTAAREPDATIAQGLRGGMGVWTAAPLGSRRLYVSDGPNLLVVIPASADLDGTAFEAVATDVLATLS